MDRPHAPSCCQVVPELRCVDKYGERGELMDEAMLCERDYGWLVREEEEAASGGRGARRSVGVVAPKAGAPLSLVEMEAHAEARTLVVDLHASDGGGPAADPLGLLPPAAEVEESVRRRLERGEGRARRHGGGGAAHALPAGSRRCVETLVGMMATAKA